MKELVLINWEKDVENIVKSNLCDENFGGIAEKIIDRVPDMLMAHTDIYDVAWNVTELENMTGSWYCSTYKAKQEIFENFEIFSEIAEDFKFQYGEDLPNIFENVENVHCLLMIHVTTNIAKKTMEFFGIDEILENYEIVNVSIENGTDLVIEYK